MKQILIIAVVAIAAVWLVNKFAPSVFGGSSTSA
jgi:hypothetical protein